MQVRPLIVALLAAAAIPALAASVQAQGPGVPGGTSAAQCVRGCAMQKKACIQGGKVTALACKQDCRDNSAPQDRGTCMRACSTAFRATKDSCNADQKTCITDCHQASPGGMSCRGACGKDLAGCAKDVVALAKTCRTGCRSADDRGACLQGCADDLHTGGDTCKADFEACGNSCP